MNKFRNGYQGYPILKIKRNYFWFGPKYLLFELSAFSFGGNVRISYYLVKRSNSIFGFRSYIKERGEFRNLYREKIFKKEWLKSQPQWLLDLWKFHE